MLTILGSFLTATLALLSMPGYSLDLAVFLAFVPFFGVLKDSTVRIGFWCGWLTGILFFGLLLHWLYTIFEWAGFFIVPAHLVLSLLLGLSWALFGAAFVWLERRYPRASFWALPALWVVLEYLRSLTKFGFSWGYLSDALYQRPEHLQMAAMTGTWSISFLIVLINYLLYRTLRDRRILYGALAAGLVVLNWSWGAYQLALSHPHPEDASLRIALIHSNVPQRARSDPDQLEQLHALYLQQLQSLEELKLDLVVLPESILPTYLLRHSNLLKDYQEVAQRLALSLVVGTIDYRDGQLFNSAALITPDSRVTGIYDKVQLVPFSTEYFPLIDLLRSVGIFPWLRALPLGALSPGERWEPLHSSAGVIGTPICFESIFPNISRAFVRQGAQLLVIITNDAWFKGSAALEQHFAKAVFRAIETGRYTVQAANGGISGVIDSKGRIRAQTRLQKETVLQEEFFLQDRRTLYVSLGDWFIYLSALTLIALAIGAKIGARFPASR